VRGRSTRTRTNRLRVIATHPHPPPPPPPVAVELDRTGLRSDQIVRLPKLSLYGCERLALGLGKPQDAADYGREAEQRRYQIVAVHATVVGQHGVNLEGQERRDGQRNSVDRVGYGPGVRREQLAVDGGQQRAKAERVCDGQPADGQHAQPPVIGHVVRGALVHVKVREYGCVERKARSARHNHKWPTAHPVSQHGGRQRREQHRAGEHQRQLV